MSFGIYAVGFAIMICGLMYGAHLMHMPGHWIAVGAIVLLGVGILSGVKATRQSSIACVSSAKACGAKPTCAAFAMFT